MRSTGRTKRELAVSAALIGAAAAQVRCEAEADVLFHLDENREYSIELEEIGQRLMAIAEVLFDRSQPERQTR